MSLLPPLKPTTSASMFSVGAVSPISRSEGGSRGLAHLGQKKHLTAKLPYYPHNVRASGQGDMTRAAVSASADDEMSVSIGRELIRLAQIIVRLQDLDLTRTHALSYRQMRILLHIPRGVTSSSELANRFGVTPATIQRR